LKRFEVLSGALAQRFDAELFPAQPATLYDPANYFLTLGGKRIRPLMCLMGNELFGELTEDAWSLAIAVEFFHNFTLIHDDIMDKAPLRRGKPTVHNRFNESSALLAGDVMLVKAYDYINRTNSGYIHQTLKLFNQTGTSVCEGQQMDMDFEKVSALPLAAYLQMIELKTAVLLAASLQLGAIAAGATEIDQHHLYQFGKNLGLSFQVQDDYLDAFGDPEKFGKEPGGDIRSNKKTFLLVKALETGGPASKKRIHELMVTDPPDKIPAMLEIFRDCRVDVAAREAQDHYMGEAARQLGAVAAADSSKTALRELAAFLTQREF
jgi:geranylgeranyl diphosphate synthase, type II